MSNEDSITRSESFVRTFVQSTLMWMAAALAITGLVSLWVASSETMVRLFLVNRFVFFGLMIAELGLVFWLTAAIGKMSLQAAISSFLAYSVLNGITMAFIFLVYTGSSIAAAFFATAGTFAVFAVYGYVTKADLTRFGQIAIMALFGVIIASVVNLFLKSPAFYWVLTYLSIAIFVGLTAYDMQRIKAMGQMDYANGGDAGKASILGALALYLDFINLFLLLLRIFGRARR